MFCYILNELLTLLDINKIGLVLKLILQPFYFFYDNLMSVSMMS